MFIPDYSKFFNDSKNLQCVVNEAGVFLSVNKAFNVIFGYDDKDLLGKAFIDLIHAESVENVKKIITNLTPGKILSELQVLGRCKNGRCKTILWNLSLDAETGNWYATGADITQIKDNEALLDDALRIAKVGGWELDLTTNVYTWTKEMYDMYGFAVNTPMKFGDLKPYYNQLDAQKNMDSINAAREQRKSYDIELKLLAADGRKLWVRAIGKPVVEDGKTVKIQGTLQDITKQKEAEILLQESEAYTKAITDASPLGIFVGDNVGNCTYSNNAYTQISGLSFAEALGTGWQNVIHPDDRKEFFAAFAASIEKTENLSATTRLIRATDNKVRFISCQSAPFYRNGELQGYVGTFEDVTEKHEIEDKIRISEQRLKEAQRMANLSSWEFILESNMMEWSEETYYQLGLDPENGIPTCDEYLKMIHPEDVEILVNSLESAMKEGIPYEIELRNIAENGEIRYVRTQGVPVYENGKLVKLTGTSLDITQQKLAELELVAAKEKAEDAMRAKAQFLSIMSHEIRTPLNAVLGITHLLLLENPKPRQMENLRTLKFSSEILLALINDILDFSKIEAGKIIFEQVNFNLLETVNGIKHSMALLAQEKGINLKFRRDEELPEIVMGDSVRLTQILVNLVSNAIKFTNSGSVTIDALVTAETETDVEIEFSVIDTGIGIEPKNIKRIFESFTQ
ncbi:MAG: PAS domain-containing protein, partial [Bacteroidia bacterium]